MMRLKEHPDEHGIVVGDETRLRQIITNLARYVFTCTLKNPAAGSGSIYAHQRKLCGDPRGVWSRGARYLPLCRSVGRFVSAVLIRNRFSAVMRASSRRRAGNSRLRRSSSSRSDILAKGRRTRTRTMGQTVRSSGPVKVDTRPARRASKSSTPRWMRYTPTGMLAWTSTNGSRGRI